MSLFKYSDKEIRMSCLVFIPGINARSREKTAGEGKQGNRPKNTKKGSDLDYPFYRQLLIKSMYIGGLISPLAASIIGTIYTLLSYLTYTTAWNCEFQQVKLVSAEMLWIRTIVGIFSCVFCYAWLVLIVLFLFRPHQP